jgi:glycosyltransferase involved in cell wall biosynthesis
MDIALVTKPDKQMTGLLRYALSLYDAFRARGVGVRLCHPRPLPQAVVRLGRILGVDAAAFAASYPLAVDCAGARVCHLASQTLASALWLQRLPTTVVTVHDIIPYLVRDDPALRTYASPFERGVDALAMRALQRADALVAISEYSKKCIMEALGVPAGRIRVIHRAVDGDAFRPQALPKAFRRRYGLSEAERYVLYVGSEDPRKNLTTLLRAFARVVQEIPQARLIKVGAAHFGMQRQRLLALVEELRLTGQVRFVDQVPDEELPWWYNAADVFVLPSLYEGFGLPALEAMSCGTPVVASNRSSLPEVVGAGGVLLDPQDEAALAQAIVALLSDAERRAAASEAALAQAARFSLERQAEETLAVYQGVASTA